MSNTGRTHEQPITSERAALVAALVRPDDLRGQRLLLAEGRATLLAVAVACYGGDVARAKATIYPPADPARQEYRRRQRAA